MASELAMFPLSSVLFPHAPLPLHVFEPRYRCLLADCLVGSGEFGVVLIERGSEVGGGDQRVGVGTAARVVQVMGIDGGRSVVLARGARRIRVARWLADDPYPRAVVEDHPSAPEPAGAPESDADAALGTARAALARLRSLLSELGGATALPHGLRLPEDREGAGWALCELAPLGPMDRQSLLAAPTLSARMALLSELCDAAAGDVVGMLSGDR